MGSQVSWQCSINGFDVMVYDVFEEGLKKGKATHKEYAERFVAEGRSSTEEAAQALKRIRYTSDLREAMAQADLVSESVPENMDIKMGFWEKASTLAPENAILTTNSSTMLPSQMASVVHRPERFLAMHFASFVWENLLCEVMGHPGTSPKSFERMMGFAKDINMIGVPIIREQPGYIINSLLVPWLLGGLKLYFSGISDFRTVDRVWMMMNNKQDTLGPFAQLDIYGLNVAYHVTHNFSESDPALGEIAKKLKVDYLDKGKTGKSSGEGFYSYPNPEFALPDFLL